jgi:hypothetical protein
MQGNPHKPKVEDTQTAELLGTLHPAPCHQALAAVDNISTCPEKGLKNFLQHFNDLGKQLQANGCVDWDCLQSCLDQN